MSGTINMKVIEEPTVYLVGYPETDHVHLQEFLSEHEVGQWETDADSDGEELVEVAGRVCYMSFSKPRPGGNEAYIGHILEVGHGSVLEHANFNMIVTGISRSCSHEFVRHRAGWSYSQLSQRYVDESVAEYVIPEAINKSPEARAQWIRAVGKAHEEYREMLALLITNYECPICDKPFINADGTGCKACTTVFTPEQRTEVRKGVRQAARSLLPNATETKIFGTANARAIRHFLELRGSRHAEPEIRAVAIQMLENLMLVAPNLFGDYKLEATPKGIIEIITQHRKV